jgi:hypothetical protein
MDSPETGKMKAIRTEAQLTSFRARADGSVGFSGVTPEMTNTEKAELFGLQNVLVELLVYPKDSKDSDVLEVRKELEGKSPQSRLRAVMFVWWKTTGGAFQDAQDTGRETFEAFYSTQMEKIIESVKRKIEAAKG